MVSLYENMCKISRNISRQNFNVILVPESRLKCKTTSVETFPLSCILHHNDRCGGGGEVAIYIHSILLSLSDQSDIGKHNLCLLNWDHSGVVCYRPFKIGLFVRVWGHILRSVTPYMSLLWATLMADVLGTKIFDSAYLTNTCNMPKSSLNTAHLRCNPATLPDTAAVSDMTAHCGQVPTPSIPPRTSSPVKYEALLTDVVSKPGNVFIEFNRTVLNIYNNTASVVNKRVTRIPAPWISDGIRQQRWNIVILFAAKVE